METHIYSQFVHCDNWDTLDCMDNWIWVIMRLPPRMRVVADLKMTGFDNKEIMQLLGVTEREVQRKIKQIKKRILRGEGII